MNGPAILSEKFFKPKDYAMIDKPKYETQFSRPLKWPMGLILKF